PGSVTSSASPERRDSSFLSSRSFLRDSSAASICCLAALIPCPKDFFSSGEREPSCFSNAVSSPVLPRNFALAFSSEAGSEAEAKSAAARPTIASRSCIPMPPRAGSVSEARLDLACDLGERGLVEHREVGEHLAIDLDLGFLHPRHERAVAHAELAHRGVDAGDPERA